MSIVPIYSTDSKIRFIDIAGMSDIKKKIRLKIVEPFLNPGIFERFRKTSGGGVLLYGPPGCGKTMLARAIASECKANFISVGISDVLSCYIGESERNLAQIFEDARLNRPSVLFFDELDALAFSRSKSHYEYMRSFINEFLAQLDGFGDNNQEILFLAATNMPWDVDYAMRRPGRFARMMFVPPPDLEARKTMLEMKLAGVPLHDVNLKEIASQTSQFSGADLDGLIDQAKEAAIEASIEGDPDRAMEASDFHDALQEVSPSTMEWLKTARNVVRLGNDPSFKDLKTYLRKVKLL